MTLAEYLKKYGISLDETKEKPIYYNNVKLDYTVTTNGDIFSYKCTNTNGPLKLKQMPDGHIPPYYVVNLMIGDGKEKTFHVHKLVALSFIFNDDPEHKTWIDHINGDKSDNRAKNLRWVTPSENTIAAYDLGLSKGRPGEKHHATKLTDKKVKCIYKALKLNRYSYYELSDLFGVTYSILKKISQGIRWKYIVKKPVNYSVRKYKKDSIPKNTILETDDEMRKIYEKYIKS